jgi:hypothetical protein
MTEKTIVAYYWEVEYGGRTYYIKSKFPRNIWFELHEVNIVSHWVYFSDQSYDLYDYCPVSQVPVLQHDWKKDDGMFGSVQVVAMDAKKFAGIVG